MRCRLACARAPRNQRCPPSQRWKAEAMAKIKATPWQPKITEPGEAKLRRRYIAWAMLSQHGSSPNCLNCKEEARERRALGGELGVLLEESARPRAMPAPQHANPKRSCPRRRWAAAPATQSSAPVAPAVQSPPPDGWQPELLEKGKVVCGHKSGQPLPEDAVREAHRGEIG